MKRLLRTLVFLMYPLMGLSALLILGLCFSTVFAVAFTVENRSGETIIVTPVGTIGKEGRRTALPVVVGRHVPIPAAQTGGFRLENGASVEIVYDCDDINFSEIVVEDQRGRFCQLVTDPNPTENQYHPPTLARYTINDLAQMPPANADVREACMSAARHGGMVPFVILVIIAGPWLVFGLLRIALAAVDGRSAAGSKTLHSPE